MITIGNQVKIDIIFDCFINIYESLDKLMKTSLRIRIQTLVNICQELMPSEQYSIASSNADETFANSL